MRPGPEGRRETLTRSVIRGIGMKRMAEREKSTRAQNSAYMLYREESEEEAIHGAYAGAKIHRRTA